MTTRMARKIERLMAQRKWTQADLAKAATLTQPTISRLLAGQYRPSFSTLKKLAKAFDVPAGELME